MDSSLYTFFFIVLKVFCSPLNSAEIFTRLAFFQPLVFFCVDSCVDSFVSQNKGSSEDLNFKEDEELSICLRIHILNFPPPASLLKVPPIEPPTWPVLVGVYVFPWHLLC